jgi:CDGSH-type Zn-finger protein
MAVDTKRIGSHGKPTETPRIYFPCRHGKPDFKPLCDGYHDKNGFRG